MHLPVMLLAQGDIAKNCKKREERDSVMTTQIFIFPVGGFVLGILIGCGFGLIQNATFAFHKILGKIDTLASGWASIPGSSARSIFLLVMLTFFQVACTLLFGNNGIQWIVSAGVVLGYVWILLRQFRQRTLYRS